MKEAQQIIKDIKNGNVKPVYFLAGEESFFIDRISNFIEENLLPDNAKGFDQMTVYGLDVNLPDLLLQARRFPMMGDKQVIIIKEAQHLFKKKQDTEALESYLNAPSETTVLVFNYKYKKLDKRKKIYKQILEKGVYFESKKIYEKETVKWIMDTVKSMKRKIDLKSAQMLIEFLGLELSKIYNELDKLNIILEPGTEITPKIIEENIGISKDYNNFELKSAIASGNFLKAQKIITYFVANPKEHPLVVTTAILYNFFRDLFIYHSLDDKSQYTVAKSLGINPYFVNEYQQAARLYPMKKVTLNIGYLQEADLKSKGVNAGNLSQKDILNELIFKLMH
jgi:DNA polymerase-3 subunit delta